MHGLQTVDLFWSGLSSGAVDIYRNGVLIVTVPAQSGFYTDHINRNGRGTYTYRVCEAGTGNCSNQVTVRFWQWITPGSKQVQSTRRRASGAASLEQRNIESPFELADKVCKIFLASLA